MSTKTCFHCNKRIEDPLDYNMMPVERPYLNLFFHKNCFKLVGGYNKMPIYLTENALSVVKLVSTLNKAKQR